MTSCRFSSALSVVDLSCQMKCISRFSALNRNKIMLVWSCSILAFNVLNIQNGTILKINIRFPNVSCVRNVWSLPFFIFSPPSFYTFTAYFLLAMINVLIEVSEQGNQWIMSLQPRSICLRLQQSAPQSEPESQFVLPVWLSWLFFHRRSSKNDWLNSYSCICASRTHAPGWLRRRWSQKVLHVLKYFHSSCVSQQHFCN